MSTSPSDSVCRSLSDSWADNSLSPAPPLPALLSLFAWEKTPLSFSSVPSLSLSRPLPHTLSGSNQTSNYSSAFGRGLCMCMWVCEYKRCPFFFSNTYTQIKCEMPVACCPPARVLSGDDGSRMLKHTHYIQKYYVWNHVINEMLQTQKPSHAQPGRCCAPSAMTLRRMNRNK